MERSENLTPEPICNENTSDFVKMAGDGAQEIGTVTGTTETDTVTDELDRDTGIPTTMLTPPPTSEPLLLNGSSRSSTNGSDLQQFTGDGDDEIAQLQLQSSSSPLASPSSSSLPPPSSEPDQVDDEHSNHSTNSDSIDSKSLIINEGPEESIDNVSNAVDRTIVDDYARDQEEKLEDREDDQEDVDDDGKSAAATATATATEVLYDECSTLQTEECDAHSENEMTSTENVPADQSEPVIADEVEDNDVDVDVDNDVIPNLDGDDSRQEIESTSLADIETSSNVDTIAESACMSVEDEMVPSQSVNGIQQSPPASEHTPEYHEQPESISISANDAAATAAAADEPDNCLANDLHIEHNKLKRKLSRTSADEDDSYETLKKQTKYDQTAASSLDSNEIDNDSNQIDVVADLISNHVTEHNQIEPVRCDSSLGSTNIIQNESDSPALSPSPSIDDVEADEALSVEHAERIQADQVIPNDEADVNANANENENVDSMDVLPATKDTIHDDDDDDDDDEDEDDTLEHKHMNGHINHQLESNSLAENEELKAPPPQQQYKQQQTIAYSMAEESVAESEFTSKIAPSSPSLSLLSSSSSSQTHLQLDECSRLQTDECDAHSENEVTAAENMPVDQSQQNDDDDDDDDDEDNLVINDTNNVNAEDTDPVLNQMESNHLTESEEYRIEEGTHTTMAEQRPNDLNCNPEAMTAPNSFDGISNSAEVDSMNCPGTNDIQITTPSPQPPPLTAPAPRPPPSYNRNKSLNSPNNRSNKTIDNRLTQQQPLNQLTECNRRNAIASTSPASTAHFRVRRQVFLCSACGTYYEKWNLFYHIREVHNKFICLYENCLGIFSSAEKLVVHLESKHVRRPHIYEHTDDLLRMVHNQCFLMCCDCEHIFTENDANDVTGHVCETFRRPCLVCGLKSHKSNCSALNSRKAIKLKSKRSTMVDPSMPVPHPPQHPQQLQPQPLPTKPLIQINSHLNPHLHSHQQPHPNHMTQQQTFLRNALLGQESRLNQHGHSGIAPNAPMLVSLPLPPHSSQMTMQMQHQLQPQPQQPHQQFPTPYPVTSFNGNIVQPPSVPKLFMSTTPMLDTSTKFYNPNQLQATNPNVYNVMYNAPPYQNLPNGQYSQNQYDARYAPPNTLLQQNLAMTMAYPPQPQPPQQQQQQHQQQRFPDVAEKVQTYDESSESPKKPARFVGSNHSNSGNSSSNSDDSNNDSDSSSNDSGAEKDDKESPKKMLVKPIRINLNSNKHISNEHGSSSTFVEQQNDSANEDEAIVIDDGRASSNLENDRYTHIQMRLDNIQQQMNAMQKTSTSQQQPPADDDQMPMLKVPKLKLKLSKPYEGPVESEQSSTESDSGSDNENDNDNEHDDEENANAMLSGMPTEMNSNDLNQHDRAMPSMEYPFALDEQQQQQQQQHDQYAYDANNSLLDVGDRFAENANESGSSAKNTSTDSTDDKITPHADDQYPAHFENDTSTQMPSAPHHPNDGSTPFTDIAEQRNLTVDATNNVANLNNIYDSTIEPSETQHVTMPPSDQGTLDDHQLDAKINENDQPTQPTPMGEQLDSIKPTSEHEPVEIMDIPPVVEEDMRPIIEFILDQPLDKIPITDFLRTCLQYTFSLCLYCNHARAIAVNGVSLAEHMISDHRFCATVDSITAEELLPETIEHKIASGIDELHDTYFNMSTYDSQRVDENYRFVKYFECFRCRLHNRSHKELYSHNRKAHLHSPHHCLMCRSHFYSYSELVCHMCPGAPSKLIPIDLKFRCVFCNLDAIPSAFRLMVHLRKKHSACDVCLDECQDQGKLQGHVWKHKLAHLCYRCNIPYHNKADITKHHFWKHGTESVLCKRCLEKKWPHVYHFCTPPTSFKCELCAQTFSKAITLKVHKRMHDPDAITFACTLESCDEKFISKKLMIKHVSLHYMPELPPPSEEKELLMHHHDEDGDSELMKDQHGDNVEDVNSPAHCLNSPKAIIEQEAPIDAVISVIEHDARERQEQEKLLKKESSGLNGSATDTPKSKSKKLKRNRSDFSDLLPDLPSLNLSESDSSSDDSDLDDPSAENSRHSLGMNIPTPVAAADETEPIATTNDETPPSESSADVKPKPSNQTPLDEDDENKATPLEADIWENFKTYQANQMLDKAQEDVEEDRLVAESVPILLHVSHSDHDYPMMYKPIVKRSKSIAVADAQQSCVAIPIIEENEKGDIKITFMETADTGGDSLNSEDPQSLAPLPASTVTISNDDAATATTSNENENSSKSKPDSDSSSDSSGSDSDSSSCSCGSNCSCTSSSSSSSSSGSGSDSSSSESKRKQRQKVLTKTRKSPGRATPERRVSIDHVNEVPKTGPENSSPKRESETSELTTAATTAGSEEQPSSATSPPLPPTNANVDGEDEKEQLAQQLEHDESENVDVEKPPDNEMVDVVTTDKKLNPPSVYTMIVESDLETTEPDTDEEFYDEHPQKLAIQMLTETRQQLMQQTFNPVQFSGLNPVNGMPYMSTMSRPATPLLQEELATKAPKAGRTKKRRRTCKNSRSPLKQAANHALRMNPTMGRAPDFPATAQQPMETFLPHEMLAERIDTNQQQVNMNANASMSIANYHHAPTESPANQAQFQSQLQAHAHVHSHSHSHGHSHAHGHGQSHSIRLSTSSCSDADSSLKRSKRRRIPNRFYGYTSDDDGLSATSVLNSSYTQNPFKPTPPPNLTWSKDDLPKSKPAKGNRIGANAAAAASATAGKKAMRLAKAGKVVKQRKLQSKSMGKAGSMKNRVSKMKEKMRMASAMPTVPKIIIRGIPRPPQQQQSKSSYQAPDLSDASRVPKAPVHHMSPPSSKFSDDQSNQSSDSESDSNLQISQPFRSNFGAMSKMDAGKNDRYQQQPQQQMPFIRPDHTLLPLRPNSYSPSLSPSPPPISSSSTAVAAAVLSTSVANQSAMQHQPAVFNGGNAQYRSTKQENNSLYCYCQRPYEACDEMIACDAQDCAIEWFHFKCVGITVAPQDKWFCPQCQQRNQHSQNFLQNTHSLFPTSRALPPQSFDLA